MALVVHHNGFPDRHRPLAQNDVGPIKFRQRVQHPPIREFLSAR